MNNLLTTATHNFPHQSWSNLHRALQNTSFLKVPGNALNAAALTWGDCSAHWVKLEGSK